MLLSIEKALISVINEINEIIMSWIASQWKSSCLCNLCFVSYFITISNIDWL